MCARTRLLGFVFPLGIDQKRKKAEVAGGDAALGKTPGRSRVQRLRLGSASTSSPRRQASRTRPASAIMMIPAKTRAVLR